MAGAKVAVIGGSGFYQMDGLTEIDEVLLNTPFGATSDAIVTGSLDGQRIAFLPRHGVGHRLAPSELPQRANIWALKSLGVEHIIAISAVGSLRAEIAPLDLVVPDQIIDRTRGRASSFFESGIVAHIAFADPFCPALARVIGDCAEAAGPRIHRGGTLVVMEGPAFSTRAESQLYRNWGASVIGMTALPEAKLAREAEICYATIACATDYDVWHESEEDVSTELVVQNLLRNVDVSKQIVRDVVGRLPARDSCPCANALSGAIITAPERISDHQRRDLAPIIGRYLPLETPTV